VKDGEEPLDEVLGKERAVRRKSITGIASHLHRLAEMLAYNVPYADQLVVDPCHSEGHIGCRLSGPDQRQGDSSTSTGIPPILFWVMFIRARPLIRIRSNRSRYQEDP
jgi:hypothetical protein